MWIYDLEFKFLSRILSAPISAAVGGAAYHLNVGGRTTGAYNYIDNAGFSYAHGGLDYLAVAIQHPSLYPGQACTIGYMRIGERVRDDAETMGQVALTPRVSYLVNDMAPSPLKDTLQVPTFGGPISGRLARLSGGGVDWWGLGLLGQGGFKGRPPQTRGPARVTG